MILRSLETISFCRCSPTLKYWVSDASRNDGVTCLPVNKSLVQNVSLKNLTVGDTTSALLSPGAHRTVMLPRLLFLGPSSWPTALERERKPEVRAQRPGGKREHGMKWVLCGAAEGDPQGPRSAMCHGPSPDPIFYPD